VINHLFATNIDPDDQRLRLEIEQLCLAGGPNIVAQIFITLGCTRFLRTEIDQAVHHALLTLRPPAGSA